MSQPTVAGFTVFVRDVMGIGTQYLPNNAPILTYAMNVALATVNLQLTALPAGIAGYWSPYELAVYNLAGDRLVNYAPDQSGETYFMNLRKELGLLSFVPGVIASSYDESTGQTLTVPDFMKTITLGDLQNLKTPWGRAYLAIAQDAGPYWGIS